MTLKLKKEKGSEVITSYLTNSNVNYIDLTDIYRLAISLGMLQQDRRWDFWGSFLVMPRWFGLTAGRTGPSVREPPNADRQPALMPVGLSATTLPYPIFLFPLPFQKR